MYDSKHMLGPCRIHDGGGCFPLLFAPSGVESDKEATQERRTQRQHLTPHSVRPSSLLVHVLWKAQGKGGPRQAHRQSCSEHERPQKARFSLSLLPVRAEIDFRLSPEPSTHTTGLGLCPWQAGPWHSLHGEATRTLTHHPVLAQHFDEVEGVEAQQQDELVLALPVVAGRLQRQERRTGHPLGPSRRRSSLRRVSQGGKANQRHMAVQAPDKKGPRSKARGEEGGGGS